MTRNGPSQCPSRGWGWIGYSERESSHFRASWREPCYWSTFLAGGRLSWLIWIAPCWCGCAADKGSMTCSYRWPWPCEPRWRQSNRLVCVYGLPVSRSHEISLQKGMWQSVPAPQPPWWTVCWYGYCWGEVQSCLGFPIHGLNHLSSPCRLRQLATFFLAADVHRRPDGSFGHTVYMKPHTYQPPSECKILSPSSKQSGLLSTLTHKAKATCDSEPSTWTKFPSWHTFLNTGYIHRVLYPTTVSRQWASCQKALQFSSVHQE